VMAATSELLLLQKLVESLLHYFLDMLSRLQNEKMDGCPYDVLDAKLAMRCFMSAPLLLSPSLPLA
jgi:hypothetical protein